MLISPVGFTYKPEGYSLEKMKLKAKKDENGEDIKRVGPPAFVSKLIPSIWSRRVSPFYVARKLPTSLSKKWIKGYVTGRLGKGESEEYQQSLADYLFQIFIAPGTTEESLFVAFDVGLFPVNNLCEEHRLGNKSLAFDYSFVFGSRDWVNSLDAEKLV